MAAVFLTPVAGNSGTGRGMTAITWAGVTYLTVNEALSQGGILRSAFLTAGESDTKCSRELQPILCALNGAPPPVHVSKRCASLHDHRGSAVRINVKHLPFIQSGGLGGLQE